MTYGGSVPAITPVYSGFENGDAAASLTTQPTCSTTATARARRRRPTRPSCSGAADPNYAISYVAGTVTVNTAPLTDHRVDGVHDLRRHGADDHAGVLGLRERRHRVVADHPADVYDHRHGSSPASASYPSLVLGAVDANYAISYVAGSVRSPRSVDDHGLDPADGLRSVADDHPHLLGLRER